MSRQLEQLREQKQRRRDLAVLLALDGGMEAAIGHAGGELQGFGISLKGGDCLMTVKVVLVGKRQIAFVGAEDMISCFLKVVREAKGDRLRWREDKYGK